MSAAFNDTVFESWSAFQQSPLALPTATAVGVGILLTVVYPALFSQRKSTDIPELGGLSILTAWPFFTKRHDFLKSNFAKVGEKIFTFKILHHSVTAVKGEEARKAFFDNRSLNFIEGYKILMGAAPRLSDIDESAQQPEDVSWFNKQLSILMHKDRLSEVLPTLFDDVQARMEGWGKEGQFDPFKNVYDLVFQMTVRMATCRELSTDMEVLNKLQHDYWTLEKSATPTALLLPWFPSPAKKNKEIATKNLFTALYGYVETRRAAEVPSSDAIDVLLAQGLSTEHIIGFVLSVVFAGVVNTGINSCWALLFLSYNKEWKKKVSDEVQSLIKMHTNTTSSDPLHKRLSAIPVSAWEEEMPAMDTVIRETIRIVMNGAALRRNVIDDLHLGGKAVPKGNFMAYQLTDAHLNPEIYTDPTEFDPTRFAPGREEDKKQTYAYLGWGAGRHPCTGMKVAKLEIKIIVALFIAGYEYDVVDSKGNFPERLPKPDYNDIQQARPIGDPCFIRFKRVVE
ncbi:Sterol 14-demethylase [Hypsizygus marmoreus]|uniref:Sterol 14-demethylase n=1 Tax=Hypsizygus marmoreus TaxID=39966 RepID=A0A369K4X3_HYPMA|nr:Sterol 14-demethylase [Hypsizygus marmoreus]